MQTLLKPTRTPAHRWAYPTSPAEQRTREEADRQRAQDELFARHNSTAGQGRAPRPAGYEKPPYNTPGYWRDAGRGWISEEQQLADHAEYETRRKRAVDSKHHRAPAPSRHLRAAPRPSRQFAKCMATAAARDDRLAPQAKALLQVLVARTGRGRSTDTTKTTLARVMSRCPRSIQRYLQELIRFGYIRTQTIKSRRSGFFVGLRVWILNAVLPFWAEQGEAYQPEEGSHGAQRPSFSEETGMSPTNYNHLFRGLLSGKKPPWRGEFAWR